MRDDVRAVPMLDFHFRYESDISANTDTNMIPAHYGYYMTLVVLIVRKGSIKWLPKQRLTFSISGIATCCTGA